MEELMTKYLPIIIHILELMGIFVITIGAFKAFYHYLKSLFGNDNYPLKYQFANSMAMGLEFKLSAEILKTVLIRNLSELAIVASIIILRAFMTFIIQYEMKQDKKA